ncbi:ParB/RepB/Spo0J family partition protein [Sphingobium sufflavum]|uniref:ParB/RepB/Spo0J family partition protein n=1 Tax=Sphingobium sufflavum TaxID=1129547 RepID=UPI001F29483B|nr:ParB/RepB/Spo0J family partition protein [Sphingobium sufflavum]MCE7795084.1 ParB/RepB/Spo0J family partition protein [Sphingobium sufflavum]
MTVENEKSESHVKTARRSPALGRGLSALFADTGRDTDGKQSGESSAAGAGANGRSVQLIDVTAIKPHPEQPRRQFDEGALQELADSIATRGVIQPIIVRPSGPERYEIVAGERRWRAAQKAQLHRIPAIVRDFDEAETLEIALIENIQREDLNPIEEARAYKKLIGQFGHSQDALGRLVGKSRSHVANLMRLLDLPTAVQDQVMASTLSMGHARALIGAPDCERLAEDVARRGLSVRDTEKLVRDSRSDGAKRQRATGVVTEAGSNADIAALERDLGDLLGMRVGISYGSDGKGTVTVHYSTLDQLDMLCQRLSGEAI